MVDFLFLALLQKSDSFLFWAESTSSGNPEFLARNIDMLVSTINEHIEFIAWNNKQIEL